MADLQIRWDEAGKWVAGAGAFVASLRALWKHRNSTHAERILRLEHQAREDERVMSQVKSEIEELSDRMEVALASTNRRVLNIETNLRDTEREIRDSLQNIVETLNRRLHAVAWNDKPEQNPSK